MTERIVRPWSKRKNYVCFRHRTHSRRGWRDKPALCPVDSEPMVNIGYKVRVPKKGDDKAWAELYEWLLSWRRLRDQWRYQQLIKGER